MDVKPNTIPVPRVPLPKINAPAEARYPHRPIAPPAPLGKPEGRLEGILDWLPGKLPGVVMEPVFLAAKTMNKVVFRSSPAGKPVPRTDGSWAFDVIGDYGSGRKPLTDVTNNILAGKPDLLLTTGDNVYYGGTEQNFREKWDPPKYFGRVREQVPVMPSLGNHDIRDEPNAGPYFRRFPELKKARFYSFDHKGVHFVALNSNESLAPGSPQHSWLSQDLEASKDPWKVVYFHHPMNSGFPKDTGPLKGYLAPLLAKHGVDLVVTGHEHNYNRTKPLNDQGTIEVITGGGGQSVHPFLVPQAKNSAYRDVDFGHLNIEVTQDALVGRYVVRNGKVRDTFVQRDVKPAAQ